MSTNPPPRCALEIDLGAIRSNALRLRDRLSPGAPLIAMVKADAYGLGAVRIAGALREVGVDTFGVAAPEEAAALRRAGVRDRIVVFGPLVPGAEGAVVDAGAEATVSSAGEIEALARAARGTPVSVHLEIDTGMGRSGLRDDDIEGWLPAVTEALRRPGVTWRGLFTHPHSADEAGRPGLEDQLRRLDAVVHRLRPPPEVEIHGANSAAAFSGLLPDGWGARPGIWLYGGRPGPEAPEPSPVAALRARIVRVVDVPAGATAGYGATYVSDRPARWATAAIGYGDGLPRLLSNRGRALVSGRSVAIVGRVSMDLTILDVTGVEGTAPGDIATFLGAQGGAEIALAELAEHARTIEYEILTGFTHRVPRIFATSP
jgi:alanine racemase